MVPADSLSQAFVPRVDRGKYRFIEVLSRNTDTLTFLAEHIAIERPVEIKTLAPGVPFPGEAGERLRREARLMCVVVHPSLPSVLDSGLDQDARPYVVYERASGTTVGTLVDRLNSGLSLEHAAAITASALDALRALHQAGIVARAFDPADLRLTRGSSGDDLVKLPPLEHAATADSHQEWRGLREPWVAPELRNGPSCFDPRSDLFIAGSLLRFLARGRGTALPPEPRFADIVARATAFNREARYADAQQMLEALAPFLSDAIADLLHAIDEPPTASSGRVRPRVDSELQGVQLRTVLFAIEAMYQQLGSDGWTRILEDVPELEALLPGAGRTTHNLTNGVAVDVFSRALTSFDRIVGEGDRGTFAEIGQRVGHRIMKRLRETAADRMRQPPANPQGVTDQIGWLWSWACHQGEARLRSRRPGEAQIIVYDQPHPSWALSTFMSGYIQGCLQAVGAVEAAVSLIESDALGDPADVFVANWRADGRSLDSR